MPTPNGIDRGQRQSRPVTYLADGLLCAPIPTSVVEDSEVRSSIVTLQVTVCRIRQICFAGSGWHSPFGGEFSSDAQRMPIRRDGNCMGDEGKAVGSAQAPAALLSTA
jgi:hypothetical protein